MDDSNLMRAHSFSHKELQQVIFFCTEERVAMYVIVELLVVVFANVYNNPVV